MFSHHAVMAIAEAREEVVYHQAVNHGTPVYAANLCASDHLSPPVPEAMAHAAIDRLERTAGEVVNAYLSMRGEASPYPRARLVLG